MALRKILLLSRLLPRRFVRAFSKDLRPPTISNPFYAGHIKKEIRQRIQDCEARDILDRFSLVKEATFTTTDLNVHSVVHTHQYFRLAEEARAHAFNVVFGLAGQRSWIDSDGIGPILASQTLRFNGTLKYPDDVLLARSITVLHDRILLAIRHLQLGADYVTYECALFSVSQKLIVAEGEAKVVFYSYPTKKRAPIPFDVFCAMCYLEVNAGHIVDIHSQPKNAS